MFEIPLDQFSLIIPLVFEEVDGFFHFFLIKELRIMEIQAKRVSLYRYILSTVETP